MSDLEHLAEMERCRQEYWKDLQAGTANVPSMVFSATIRGLMNGSKRQQKEIIATMPHDLLVHAVSIAMMELAHRRCQEEVENRR